MALTWSLLAMSIADRLTQHHQRLAALLSELSEAAAGADAPTLHRIWQEAEDGLRSHFDAEERLLLPLLRRARADECAEIVREHQELKEMLDEVGLQVELHIVRRDRIDALIQRLRTHARREDEGIYRWCEVELSADDAQKLRGALSARDDAPPLSTGEHRTSP